MLNTARIDSSLFGVWLGGSDDIEGGEITFGSIDETRYSGEITWAPVFHIFNVCKGYAEGLLGG
jgi:hypothetical protein